jgi:hypothetical protein
MMMMNGQQMPHAAKLPVEKFALDWMIVCLMAKIMGNVLIQTEPTKIFIQKEEHFLQAILGHWRFFEERRYSYVRHRHTFHNPPHSTLHNLPHETNPCKRFLQCTSIAMGNVVD